MSEGDPSLVITGITAEQLCGYVSRVERLEEEIGGLNDDKKDIYAEAKSVGFDPKILKKVIARRRKDRDDVREEDQMLDFYEGVINGRLGKPKKEVDPLE